MTHRIKMVTALEKHILSVTFQNGVIKEYDLKKAGMMYPQLKRLIKDVELFKRVRVDTGGYGISWSDELDLDAEELWEEGIQVDALQEISICDRLAVELVEARSKAGMTQKQLADLTGIYQADISKIERGLANPSLSTLDRLAKGLNMQLSLRFYEVEKE